jgi:hypothetical protein
MQFILLAIFKEMIFNHLDFCIKFLKHQKKKCASDATVDMLCKQHLELTILQPHTNISMYVENTCDNTLNIDLGENKKLTY